MLTLTINNPEPVLIIKPDGTKLRGSDNKPLQELSKEELLEVISKLCDLFMNR